MHNQKAKQKKLIALKKASSLINKIIQMVEDEQYCIDVMQQNLAVIGLLKSFHSQMMEAHLESCLKDAIEAKDEQAETRMLREIMTVNNLFNR